ncbi:MAG: AMP-binding protein [Bryobacteraceae bacterium]|nr:AMP-binding protein [Bryobacteraceae bacterium]
MNLYHLFDHSLIGRAGEVALEFAGTSYSFGEIESRSNRLAHALARRGVRQGDRVAVYLPNCVETIDLFLACAKLGAIFVPVNILYRERELSHILNDAEPALFVDANTLPELRPEAAEMPDARPQAFVEGDDPAVIVYTSGTTGTSKGATLTHNNLAANAMNIAAAWGFSSTDRLLLPLPLFHVHGLGNGLHAWLLSGCRLRLLERFDHRTVAQEFSSFRPTVFFGVPAMYVRLLDLDAPIGDGARLFVCGSAPLAAQTLEDFEKRFGQRILERYGMTEALMIASNPYFGERRAGTVGLPMPGVSVEIRDASGNVVPAGEEGELYVRGPNVFPGYWRRPDARAAAFSDGWFRTGDMGVRSPDGYLTLQGRASDLIISGGFNIYPREIEEFLLEQPGVREAAVAGLEDRVRGEVPVAYVVADETFDEAAVEARCRAVFASFKVPRKFVRLDSLPRTALGKVQKRLLPK